MLSLSGCTGTGAADCALHLEPLCRGLCTASLLSLNIGSACFHVQGQMELVQQIDLMELVQQIVPFNMTHNAEPDAVDLLLEV
eukprot:scaffold204233_cov23-Tisochrysis_lutea.AAC.1